MDKATSNSIGALGVLMMGLGLRMSMFRVEAIRTKSPGVLESKEFFCVSRAQLNNAEYAPIIAAMLLAQQMKANNEKRVLTRFEKSLCYLSVISCCVFVHGVINTKLRDNLMADPRGTPLTRPLGATMRYLVMLILGVKLMS